MAEPQILRVPRVNNNDDVVELAAWCVAVGQTVRAGQVVATVETAKGTVDVEATRNGVLRWQVALEGHSLAVGTPLALLTDAADERFEPPATTAPAPPSTEPAREDSATVKARLLARRLGVSIDDIGRHTSGQVTEEAVRAFVADARLAADEEVVLPGPGSAPLAVIVGDGAHARYVYDVCRRVGGYTVVGCVSNARPRGDKVGPLPVACDDDGLTDLFQRGVRLAMVGVGSRRSGKRDNEARRAIYQRLKTIGYMLPVLIDPDASVSASATLGEGTLVGARAVVSSHVRVGVNCLVNVGSIVCHDCVIEDHVHLTPGSILGGGVRIGEGSTVGMAATVLDGTSVGRGCLVPNGARVIADLRDGAVAR